MATKRARLDEELVAQGYFDDVADALRSVLAGEVSSRGERLTSPGMRVKPGVELHVKGRARFVSRGGLKLEGALAAFGLDPAGMSCVDVGCSTGGFTDCLLSHARVALFENTNICTADPEALGAPFDLAVADVSFTSVEHILESVAAMLREGGLLCTLVKPQFEARREEVGEGGVVRDPAVHARVLARTVEAFAESPLAPQALAVSPIHGAKGNVEFFLLAQRGGTPAALDVDAVVAQAHASDPASAARA